MFFENDITFLINALAAIGLAVFGEGTLPVVIAVLLLVNLVLGIVLNVKKIRQGRDKNKVPTGLLCAPKLVLRHPARLHGKKSSVNRRFYAGGEVGFR